MNSFRLALDMLRRDARAGELHMLAVALLVAVASLTSVGFFADRVQQSLARDATQLMGGDVLVSGDAPLPPAFRAEAERLGLRAVDTTNFSSMVSTDDLAQLAAVKSVEAGYPLRGSLKVSQAMGEPGVEAGRIPAPGEAFVEERLLTALQLQVGDTLNLGYSRFRVGALIRSESDRGTNFFSFIPRIMINAADLEATGLVQPGSRIRYRLQLAGERAAVARFEGWVKPQIRAGQQLESIDNARPEIRGNLARIQRFLQLSAMLSVVLAGVAIGLGARRYLQRHLDGCAAMRCFGARRSQLLALFLGEFAVFSLLVSLLGALLGYLLQMSIAGVAAGFFKTVLPQPGWLPVLQAVTVGMVLMLGFIAPQLLHMTRVPPVHVLRREWGAPLGSVLASWLAGGVALLALFLWVAGDLKLGAVAAAGFAAAAAVFALLARLALEGLSRLRGLADARAWGLRYGLAAMHRRMGASMVQTVALGLGLMAMLLLGLVSSDLLSGWQRGLREEAPDHFILNIQPEQREAFTTFFAERGLPPVTLAPMVRARLVELRGRPVRPEDYEEGRGRNLADREFNLSYGSQLQEGNRIVAGRWHGDARVAEFSMEEGVGRTLGVQLGDAVVFEGGGVRVAGRVSSIRKLDWDSMRVNFFFTAAPGLIEPLPATWITSFRLPEGREGELNAMVAAFPNISVIDVGAVLDQVRELSGKLILVVQFVLAFSLLAGLVVMFAALRATHDERMHELSVLRTLGASNRQLRQAMLAEFFVLGGMAAVLAGLGAMGTGYVLASQVLEIPYSPDWLLLALWLILAALGVLAFGWLGVRGLLGRPVMDGLRARA